MNNKYTIKLHNEEYSKLHIGNINIYAQYKELGIYLAVEKTDKISESFNFVMLKSNKNLPLECTWKRWILGYKPQHISFLPALPNRPVVIRPYIPTAIPPDRSAFFYIKIPLCIRVQIEGNSSPVLCEIPTVTMSNTWFGDVTAGELCYLLKAHLSNTLADIETNFHYAICPVTIKNTSKSELEFQRFCLHLEYLAIFQSKKNFWTNPVDINFQEEELLTHINISKSPPASLEIEGLICEPREKNHYNFVKKSFQFLKEIAGL